MIPQFAGACEMLAQGALREGDVKRATRKIVEKMDNFGEDIANSFVM